MKTKMRTKLKERATKVKNKFLNKAIKDKRPKIP